MSFSFGSTGRGKPSDAARILVLNNNAGTIPARSFVMVTGGGVNAKGYEYLTVDQPDSTASAQYLVTDAVDIATGEEGIAFDPTHAVWVTHDSAPTPVVTVGPVDSTWTSSEDGSGFSALSTNGTLSLVRSVGGSGVPIVEFQIISVDLDNRTALCQLEAKPVNGEVPDTTVGGTVITVHDPYGEFLNNAERTYVGDPGAAVYLDPVASTEVGNEYGENRWSFLWIGCGGETCF